MFLQIVLNLFLQKKKKVVTYLCIFNQWIYVSKKKTEKNTQPQRVHGPNCFYYFYLVWYRFSIPLSYWTLTNQYNRIYFSNLCMKVISWHGLVLNSHTAICYIWLITFQVGKTCLIDLLTHRIWWSLNCFLILYIL